MDTIKYSYNWNNKLNCDIYTTIRLATGKYKLNETYAVNLKGTHISNAIVLDVQVITIDQLKPWIAYLDTGYSLKETKEILYKMYPNADWHTQLIAVILCKRIPLETEVTTAAKQKDSTGHLFNS
jgi:hypothetical protein